MKVVADLDKCQGYVCCVMEAGDVFDIDDNGKVVVLTPHPVDARRDTVEAAIRQCPVSALSFVLD